MLLLSDILTSPYRPPACTNNLSEGRFLRHIDTEMEKELSELPGRSVDLVSKRAIEMNKNWLIRDEILNSSEIIYAA
jgi:predicted nucleotidyltransferase